MLYNATQKVIQLSGGREIIIETGKLAKQADGAVVVRQGDTMLLATVVAAKEPKPDCDFMPLSVEYKEKYAAAGRFPGGFLKREARPSDYEILIARLIDRALRPLFPSDFHAEVFVTVNLISAEKILCLMPWLDWPLRLLWLFRMCLLQARFQRCVFRVSTANS